MKRSLFIFCALLLAGIGARAGEEDLTSLLQNPSFENCDTTVVDTTRARKSDGAGAFTVTASDLSAAGWTLTNTPGVCDIMTANAAATDNDFGAPGAPSEGEKMLYLRDSWSGGTTTTLMQTVSLTAGTYKVTVDSKCIHQKTDQYGISDATAKLVAGGEHAELPYHSLFVPDDWDETSVTFTLANDGDVEIGVEIYYPSGQPGFSVLLDNFTIAEATDVELTAHYEEAEFSHWSISGNTNGAFQYNTWSTEVDTESGMAIPFIEYWVGAGGVLSDATIKHQQLQGLPAGNYIVSVFARAFNEAESGATSSAAAVGSGITFTANGESVDLTTGTAGTFGYSTEVYGVYELKCTVTDDGTLDIGFTVAGETACDWMAFKDLKVVMDTEDYPELTAPTGDMDPEVQAAMEEAIQAYTENPSGDNFLAAIEAIQDAYASIAAYAADLNGKDFLIMNEDDYYLAGGLDYGTHAMLGGKPQFITFEAQTDGTYMLDTHQYNYGNHYFGTASTTTASSTDFYFDALYPLNWTVEEVDGGGYLISNTTVGYIKGNGFQNGIVTTTDPSEATVWTLVTKDDVIAKMENATVDNPVDVTALIPAPEPKHNNWENSWTMTAYDGVSSINNGTLGQDGNTASCAETWHSSNGFDMHQIVTFPMAGYYVLTSQAFHDLLAWGSDIYPSMYAGDRSVEIYHGTVSSTGGVTDMANAYQDLLKGLHPLSLCLYVEEDDTDLTVGFTSNRAGGDVWTVFGELGLQYLGNDSYEGFVVHEEEAEVGDWSDGNVGTFHLNNWSSEDDPSGMVVPFMEYWCGSGYTLTATTISHEQLTGLYPGMYEVSLDIRVLNENGSNVTEGTLFKANDASEDLVTGSDSNDGTFGTNDDVYGTYTLTCVVDGKGTLDISIEIPDDVTYDWIAFKNLKVTYLGDAPEIEWTLGASYGTLILPFAYDLSADTNTNGKLTAYTVASIDATDTESATLTLSDGTTSIEANTPYIIGGTTGEYSFIGIPTNDADSYTSADGYLTGYMVADYAPANSYVLQLQDEEVGPAFYLVESDNSITVGAYHCYLNYASNGVKLVVNFPDTDDVATRIDAVETEETASEAIYDLSGRRVAKAQKGVYIVNGKKMVIK